MRTGLTIAFVLVGCASKPVDGGDGFADGGDDTTSESTAIADVTGDDGSTSGAMTTPGVEPHESSSDDEGGPKFDQGSIVDLGDADDCELPPHTACDDDEDPGHALGLDCAGELDATITFAGQPAQLVVHAGDVGSHLPPTYPPREGGRMLILSTGEAADVLIGGVLPATTLSTLAMPLAAPLDPMPAVGDCTADAAAIGTGDCSATMDAQWTMGGAAAYDYAEIRIEVVVPAGAAGFAYDLAFLSAEYPIYYQEQYNDMFVAWLESGDWTGNVSFDDGGQPIALNAAFLDFKDAPNPYDCPAPCVAPELVGTAMDGHGGTRWLTTAAPVTAGESITLVLAIFDMGDGWLDSAVLLDNFRWTCEGEAPITEPAG